MVVVCENQDSDWLMLPLELCDETRAPHQIPCQALHHSALAAFMQTDRNVDARFLLVVRCMCSNCFLWSNLDALHLASHCSLQCNNGGFLIDLEQQSVIPEPFQVCCELLNDKFLFALVSANVRECHSRLVVVFPKDKYHILLH